MERERAKAVIEAVLFTMGESVEVGRIAKVIEQDVNTTKKIIPTSANPIRYAAHPSALP